MILCPACNTLAEEDADFCYNCGRRLPRPQDTAPPPAPNWQQPVTPAPDERRFVPTPSWEQPTVAPPGRQDPLHDPVYLPPPPAAGSPGAGHHVASQPPSFPASPTATPSSTMAIVSLIAGIVAWVIFPFISAIVAVICGHLARREIRDSGGRLTGAGMALAGLVLGYLQLAITGLFVCAFMGLIVLGAAA
jgi:hypothetical protein